MSNIQYCIPCQRQVTPKPTKWGGGDLVLIIFTLGFWIFPKLLLSRSGGRCPICNTKLSDMPVQNIQSSKLVNSAVSAPQMPYRQQSNNKVSASRIVLLTGSAIFFLVVLLVTVGVIANINNSQSSVASKAEQVELDKANFREKIAADIAKEKEAIRKKEVYIGMDADAAEKSWGKPRSINRTTNGNSTNEQWVYKNGSYLYFVDGKITTIQN